MKNLAKYIDIGFCLVVLPVMVIMFPIERWYHNFQTYVISLGIWLYCLYFLNRLVTVPSLFKEGRSRWLGAAMIIVSLIITDIFSSINLYTPPPNLHDIGIVKLFPGVKQYQQAVWSLFMIVEAFSFAVGLLTQTEIQRTQRRKVEAERDRAEIALYKAQIKPHFMFNTLNSLYGLFLTGNKKALPSLEKFIDMMRYLHTSARRELVPLREECDYIEEYVELQSLRLSPTTHLTMVREVENPDLEVPPMLLITFIENCFKHGVSTGEESVIRIEIKENGGVLELMTLNRIFPVRRPGEHLGIENCRRRLELSYPSRHELKIEEIDNHYHVQLKINL